MVEQNIADFLNKINLNYECKMKPLLAEDNLTAGIGDLHSTDFYGTFDTTNNKTYGCFKKNYVPVNPRDVVEELYATLPKYPRVENSFISNYKDHKGNKFSSGEKFAISLKLNTDQIDYKSRSALNQDHIDNYLVIGNSHGGGALKLGFMTYTASCANVFGNLAHSFRHSRGVKTALEVGIGRALHSLEEFKRELEILNEFEMNDSEILYALEAIQDEFFDNYATKLNSPEEHLFKTRTKNNVSDLSNRISQEMLNKGRTGWGLLSGVTNFTTHAGNSSNKAYTKLDGSRGKRDEFAKKVILDLAM
jgi:hypothetical protein